jgi:Coenzyme PQQ synthesis protein D (PqqD)
MSTSSTVVTAAFPPSHRGVVQRAPGVVWRDGEFGVVLLAPGAPEPKTLTGTGRELWRAIVRPMTAAELAAELALTFDADAARVEADITPVLDELTQLGVLELVPAP